MSSNLQLSNRAFWDIDFTSLTDEDGLIVTSARVPSRNLVLSRAREADIEKLAEDLFQKKAKFPGIMGPSDVAANFANAWTALSGQKSVEFMDQIIYAITKVVTPPKTDGSMRLFKPDEKKTLVRWLAAFSKDALPKAEQLTPEDAEKRADDMIKADRAYAWVIGGKPVCQAIIAGTSQVARIGAVYTPPEARGMGYASSLVAAISQKMLDEGKTMCCLYADARNPVSNSIYRKIGYEFVGRSSLYVLQSDA